jgi:hypothetical protein
MKTLITLIGIIVIAVSVNSCSIVTKPVTKTTPDSDLKTLYPSGFINYNPTTSAKPTKEKKQ